MNGEIEEEQQQKEGGKLEKSWLVNGVGKTFGDDSLRYVDELLIYDRPLSSSEIRSLYNRCVFNRMVFHYGFQKGNISNLIDQSGLHNDAKLIGGKKSFYDGNYSSTIKKNIYLTLFAFEFQERC